MLTAVRQRLHKVARCCSNQRLGISVAGFWLKQRPRFLAACGQIEEA